MKHFTKLLGILFLLTILSCTSVCHKNTCPNETKKECHSTQLILDPDVKIGTLNNGLKYYIRQNQKPENRAVLRLVVNAGSVLEDEDQKGLAHFIEHMAFNGTVHFNKSELVDYLEGIGMKFGAGLNAYTSFDETVYMLQVPMDDPEAIQSAFQILEDWAHGILFEEEEIDKERGVIKEEWRLGQGAWKRMWNQHAPKLLNNSMYSKRLPIGDVAVIDTAHYETFHRFYNDWYRPDLMAVVAVGDFNADDIEQLVHKHFEGIPVKDSPRERIEFEIPDHEETIVAIASDPEATRTNVNVYFKRPVEKVKTEDAYRQWILERLYSGMINARFSETTKTPNSPFMYAYSYTSNIVKTKSAHVLMAGVKEVGILDGLKALLTEAERIDRFGFTSSELERQKMEIMRSIEQAYDERDKTESKLYAGEYVRHYLQEEPIPGIEQELALYQKYLPSIHVDEINQMNPRMLSQENRVITVGAPEKDGLTLPTEEELLSQFQLVKEIDILPYTDVVSNEPLVAEYPKPAEIVSTKIYEDIGVETLTLTNGIHVILKQTQFKNDEVLFNAFSQGGTSLIDDEDFASGDAAADLIETGGLGTLSQIELEKKLTGKVVSVSPYINQLYEGLSGSASPKDLETMFQLIYLYFTSPRMDEEAFTATLSRWRGYLENRSSRPESAFQDTIQVTMAQHHLRERPWDLDFLQEIDPKKAYAFYQDRYLDAGDFTFTFVGNYDSNVIIPLVQTWLGGLPTNQRKESWVDHDIQYPIGAINKSVFKGVDEKSMTQMMFTGPFEWSNKNNYLLQSMVQAFQIKLREILREELGGVYGVGVWPSISHYPDEEYKITISFGCAPDRVDELTNAVYDQIDSLMTLGTTDKYLNKVKETQKRERETSLLENNYWLRKLTYMSKHEVDFSLFDIFNDYVEDLSLSDIQKTAKTYFDTENVVQITLYPEDRANKEDN